MASNVTSYSSTFVPSTNVDVQDLITGATSTKGVKICFEGATPTPAYLKKCARTPVALCATLAKVTGGWRPPSPARRDHGQRRVDHHHVAGS